MGTVIFVITLALRDLDWDWNPTVPGTVQSISNSLKSKQIRKRVRREVVGAKSCSNVQSVTQRSQNQNSSLDSDQLLIAIILLCEMGHLP